MLIKYYGIDDIDSFLDVNFKVCRDVMCPANKDADEPARNLWAAMNMRLLPLILSRMFIKPLWMRSWAPIWLPR